MAGLALVGAGVVSKIFSSATTPEADIRMWDNLPLYISFVALELPAGQHTLTVEFLDGQGRVLPGQTRSVPVTIPPEPQDTVVYVSDKTVIAPPQPPADSTPATPPTDSTP
jgi:hypothetical protein